MTTKHTPAPWQIDDKTFVYALGPGGTNKFFLSVQAAGPERIGEPEKEANACLIAAAPELLAACQAFSKMYGRLWDTVAPEGGGFLGADSVKKYDEIHAQMSAAIAKAIGAA